MIIHDISSSQTRERRKSISFFKLKYKIMNDKNSKNLINLEIDKRLTTFLQRYKKFQYQQNNNVIIIMQ